ncbi:MAG: TonB-dependent receptor [Gammaproteobacteria bacterium]|nr:TonB-dependent receptor [Gammaproteobacteria bacterium]
MKFSVFSLTAILLTFPLMVTAAEGEFASSGDGVDSAHLPEELIVSGYRTVSPQELDTSITLLDAATIQSTSIGNFEELVQLVPNMNFSGEGSRARYFQLRGVGEREQYEGAPNPSVGFIVDDIDLSGMGGVTSTYDLQQVDVLRGPQSARYGSSALAGIVYSQSAMPTEEFNGNFEMTGGSEDTYAVGAAVGGSLSNSLNGRFSIFNYTDNGFRNNDFLNRDDTNKRDELTLRGKLSWDIANDWVVLFSGLYADFDNNYDAWTVTNTDNTQSDNPGKDSQKTTAGSIRITGGLTEAFNLVSITSLAHSEVDFGYDGDWGNEDFWLTYGNYQYDYIYTNPRDHDTLSQEFRLVSTPQGRLFNGTSDWVLGVSWQSLDEDNSISSVGFYSDVGEEDFCNPACFTDRQINSDFNSDTYAVFSSIDSSLTDKLTLSVGLRYEYWEADYSDIWMDINYPGPPNNQTCDVIELNCKPDESLWGGHLAFSYDWTVDQRAYVRIARGFKAGGFNPSLAALQGGGTNLGPEFLAYDDETLWNYELGLKGAWLQGDLIMDIAVFYMDRQDAQLSQSYQQVPFDPDSFVFVTYNGDADVYGLEISSVWQFANDWQLHGSLGLLESEINSSAQTNAVSPNAVGRNLAHAPAYTLNLGVTYRNAYGYFSRLDVTAVDEFYFDISNNQKSDTYEIVNLRFGKEWENWSVEAWGRNIFDEDYATRGFYFGNEPPNFTDTLYTKFGDPRIVGATLHYRY